MNEADDTAVALTRSEEELRVGTEVVESERIRLRKQVITETETHTVVVRREELVIEQLTPDAAEVPAETTSDAFAEEAFDLVLYEERVVSYVEVVPRETVRVTKMVVEQQTDVSADIAKEVVRIEGGDDGADAPFPIKDYDSLSVSQISTLLPQLYDDELDVIEHHEREKKQRATLLRKIEARRNKGFTGPRPQRSSSAVP